MFKNQELLSILALAAIAVAGLGVPVAQAGDISGVTNLLAANHYDEADLRQLEMFNADTGQWMFTFDPLPGGLQASMGTKATEFHDGYWYTFTTVDEPNRIAAVYRYDIDGTNPTLVAENVTGMIEGFAADDNHLYVGTKGGWGWTGGLYKFDMSTTPYTPLGQINAGNFAGMDFGPDGNLYSGNEGTGKVSIHDTDGNGLGQFDLTRAYRPEFHPDGDLYVTSYSDNPVVSHYNSPLHADPLLLVEEIPVPDFGGWFGVGDVRFLGDDTMFVSIIGQDIARYVDDGEGWTLDPEAGFVLRPEVDIPRTWSFAVGTVPESALTWDGADSTWEAVEAGDSHWDGGEPSAIPTADWGAVVDTGVCTVPDAYSAEAKTTAVGPDGTLIVNGDLTTGSLTSAESSTLGGNGTISAAGEVMLDGTVAPGNSLGALSLDVPVGAELGESAVYQCEIGDDDAPVHNDTINVVAGDLTLGGRLELVATSKLRGPDGNTQWIGKQDRTIVTTEGDSSVTFYFDATPTPLPADFGTADWGEGHIGHGVFLTRENNGGENDVEGVSYSEAETVVHLFQALDGDTNGDMILDTGDIFAILGAGSFLTPGEWDWTEGDFDGDTDVDTDDIFAILATGQWGDFTPYYPEPGKASAAKGEADAVVDLIVNPETGEVSIDTHGAEITGYKISSDSGALSGEAATQFTLTEQTAERIADMLPLGKAFNGVHDLGSVLDGNGGDLTLTYTLAGQTGVFQGNVKVVPEPGTLAMLLATGLLGLLAALQRRHIRTKCV